MYTAGTAYLVWLPCLCGLCGLHRLYAGKPLTGLLWLFTLGLLGVGQVIDLLLIPGMVAQANLLSGRGVSNANLINVQVSQGDYRPRRGR
jgi:TM2 domain-containing membrane protein YozV